MLNLFPTWVKILVAAVLAVFAVAEAVPMVLTSWSRYEAEKAMNEAKIAESRAKTDLAPHGFFGDRVGLGIPGGSDAADQK